MICIVDFKELVRIDAKTFQEPLIRLASTMVEKVFREGVSQVGWPPCVSDDVAVMLRYSLSVHNLLCYLNADERRNDDHNWRVHYGVTAMSLVRSLIDCLYNVTVILEDPGTIGPAYRKSGMKKMLKDLEEDHQKYAGQEKWETYVDERRRAIDGLIRGSGFTVDEVLNQKTWLTLGRYLNKKQPGGILTPHQEFLKTFTYLGWRQYSALSHGVYEAFNGTMGHIPIGAHYMNDFLPHNLRVRVDESYGVFVSTHVGRAATVLLCLITEVQAYCRFDGANIDERVCRIWEALIPVFEAKELYDGRYTKLMMDKGMLRP